MHEPKTNCTYCWYINCNPYLLFIIYGSAKTNQCITN
ncbi:MAG: hypothetical protein K2Q24_06065 [Chitinophagaceae bacterium]|nr:hypothetical protein [Chitinophagaceae bacterium]